MNRNAAEDKVSESFKYFIACLKNSYWAQVPSEETIDSSFKAALELEEIGSQEENYLVLEKLMTNYPKVNFKKPTDLLMQYILQNHCIDEFLTLYAINKYTSLYSKSEFLKLLDRTLSEVDLRRQMFRLIEEFPDVDVDFYAINNFLCDLLNSGDLKSGILNSLKYQTSVLLKALRHGGALDVSMVVEEVISCLESQTDLKLWLIMMKDENVDMVLDVCAQHRNFLQAVFKFFDKFAYETETNYDEELNVTYSHLYLDIEDFIRILKLYLNKSGITKSVNDFLESKTLNDKNFCFWADVKACL